MQLEQLFELVKTAHVVDASTSDRAVIDACTDFLPFLNAGAFDDPRL